MTMTIDRAAAAALGARARAGHDEPRAGFVASLVRHRLFQFAALGGALFAIAPRPESPNKIAIQGERLGALQAAEAKRRGGSALSAEKAREVDQRAIEDEILYREGVRLGLDRNDGIVRQRVAQKVLFLAEEAFGATRPASDDELARFFEANRARWRLPEKTSFTQVYAHNAEDLAGDEPPEGEPSPVAREVTGSRAEIASRLGVAFADAIAKAPTGVWTAPIASPFGFHRVRVDKREPGREARLDEVKSAVIEAERVHRKQEAVARFLKAAAARYDISIDGKKVNGFEPSRRIAFRMEPSGEDE
jgi:hypothetical protein